MDGLQWLLGTLICLPLSWTFEYADLAEFPSDASLSDPILDIVGGTLTVVPDDRISPLVHLEELVITDTALHTFPNLNTLALLELLFLKDNQIDYLPSDAFVNNPLLEYVDLKGNQFGSSTNYLLLPPLLEKLYIEYNDLTSIEFGKVDPDAPSVVERIRLRYNNLNALPLGLDLFTGLLESFRLDDNPIGALTADEAAILTNTPVLNDLSLENCSLRHVPDVTSGLNSGVVLSIDLTSNPLLCDRNLKWLKSDAVDLTIDPTPCASPVLLSGRTWDSLTTIDFLEALDPVMPTVVKYNKDEPGHPVNSYFKVGSPSHSSSSTEVLTVRSKLQCSTKCTESGLCYLFIYNQTTKTCELRRIEAL